MSPQVVRGTGTCHMLKQWKQGGERGWEENCPGDALPHYETQENASCTCYAKLQSTRTWNSDTCANVSRPLTSRGMQTLFVVNSIQLHLTALKKINHLVHMNTLFLLISGVSLPFLVDRQRVFTGGQNFLTVSNTY